MIKRYGLTEQEVSEKAFTAYSDSDLDIFKSFDDIFFIKWPGENPIEIGTLKDIDSYLVSLYDECFDE